MSAQPNAQAIVAYLHRVVEPGTVVELRILNVADNPKFPPFVVAGYFDANHLDELAQHAIRWTAIAEGCYAIINPANPALLARADNRVMKKPKHTTTDAEIARRVGLVFDADPKRPPGISATDAEKSLARERIDRLIAELSRRGWPDPIVSDSGNGYHARYRIDLANNEGSLALITAVLKAASAMFSDDHVEIDPKLSNAARIIKLPGTLARKGDSTPDRPHRLSKVLRVPDNFQVVPVKLLEEFAAENQPGAPQPDPAVNAQPNSSFKATASDGASPEDRARAYVFTPGFPDSIAGEHGHDKLFRVACILVDEFGLTRSEALPIFRDWNRDRAQPPESDHQIEHKVDSAIKKHPTPSLKLLNAKRARSPSRCAGKNSNAPTAGQGNQETQSEVLLRLASVATLFHDATRRAFAAIPVKGHVEVHAVRSTEFRQWLKGLFYSEENRPPAAQSFEDALGMLEARACFDGPTERVHVRVAGDTDRIFVDLGDADWRAVEITAADWRVLDASPVRFRRPRGMLALPSPQRGGSLEGLKVFANCAPGDFILIVAWLAAALRPVGPWPLLVLTGEQGSAKSTLAKMLKTLIDAHVSMVRSSPRDERDLAIAASNNWLVSLDNVSWTPPWLSDALCRLSTGGGFATRELYTDDEERVFDAQRPITLNGITDFVDRPDLMDRAIFVHLAPILDNARRDERELWESFKATAPALLGALLDAVANGLKMLPKINPASLPRMADFARFGEAVSRAIGNPPDEFLGSYRTNRKAANESALDDSPIAGAVRKLPLPWEGSASELLAALNGIVSDKVRESKRWPKSPRGMSGAVKRLAPQLRMVGVNVVHAPRTNTGRTITIEAIDSKGEQPSQPSQPSPSSPPRENKAAMSDGSNGQPSPTVTQPSPAAPKKTRRPDDRDGSIPNFLTGDREITEL